MNPLKQLEACGRSPRLDYPTRCLIESGELRTLIERDGLKGVTSHPSIFERAGGTGSRNGCGARVAALS
jgi:transaldolase/glucose-6-phosphate isomerase